MNAHIEHQVIHNSDGSPAFVVVPYGEYLELVSAKPDEEVLIPHEVIRGTVQHGWSLIKAWREHLGLTQSEMAERIGVSQSAFAQMESPEANPRIATLKKIAQAFGVEWEALQA
jgi:DNA-binding XRE family transcriptional regulator